MQDLGVVSVSVVARHLRVGSSLDSDQLLQFSEMVSVAKAASLMRGRATLIRKRWRVNHTLPTFRLLFLAQHKLGPVGMSLKSAVPTCASSAFSAKPDISCIL